MTGRTALVFPAVVAAGLVAAVTAARRRLLVIEVVGESMMPAYRHGDRLLVLRTHRVRRGDVVIAHHREGGDRFAPGSSHVTAWLVKRLAAVPGDAVPDLVVPATGGAPGPVPAGMTVLLGDHPESADSRLWGLVPLADVGGVVVARLRRGADTEGRDGQ